MAGGVSTLPMTIERHSARSGTGSLVRAHSSLRQVRTVIAIGRLVSPRHHPPARAPPDVDTRGWAR